MRPWLKKARLEDVLLDGLIWHGNDLNELHSYLKNRNDNDNKLGFPIMPLADFDNLYLQVKSKAESIAIPIQFRLSKSPTPSSHSYYHTLDKIEEELKKIPSKETTFDKLVFAYIENMLKGY